MTAGAAALIVALVGCIDPRLPFVEEEIPVLNQPPVITLSSVTPPPAMAAEEAKIGTDCPEAEFSVNEIVDPDLPAGAALSYRWRVQRSGATGPALEPRQVESGPLPNLSELDGASLGPIRYTLTRESLEEEFFNLLDIMNGETHRLELFVTDGQFVDDDDEVDLTPQTADKGVAYFYWLFLLRTDPC